MATKTTKTTTKKAAATKEKAVKAVEDVKEVSAKGVEAAKEALPKAVEEAKEAPAKAVKKVASRKTAAQKAVEPQVFVQYLGKEVKMEDIVASVKNVWVNEMGRTEAEIKDLRIYVKPEDNGAHFVINDEVTGFVGM